MADEAKARGNAAFSTGNFTEAINISPTNHILYSNRSAAHASVSNFSQALTDAQKTVQLKPDWSKGYSRLGAAYMGLQNYSSAVSSYEKGLEIDPNNEVLKSGLADATSLSQKQVELRNDFRSARTSAKMLKALKEMEPYFDESGLGMEYWAIARELLSDGELLRKKCLPDGGIQERVVSFGKRALKALLNNDKKYYYTNLPCIRNKFSNISIVDIINENVDYHESSLFVASACALLGAACLNLKRCDESFSYLNRAYTSLTKLEADEGDNRCGGNCVLHVLDLTLIELCKVKQELGRLREGVPHLKKLVENREKCMEEDCFELGQAYKDACAGYMAVLDTNQARPFCLKALEIFKKHAGPDSVEVAELRRNLGIIYHDSKEFEKANEQNRLALGILKKHTPDSPELLELEMENAHMMLALGRHEEVIKVLKGMVSRDDIGERYQAMSYVIMANNFYKLGNFADAKKYMRIAETILEKKGVGTSFVAILFGDMSDLYQNMIDLETAMSLSKRALSFPNLPDRVLAECSSRIFSLVSLSGKEKEEISYMKDLVEKLKEKFGPVHCEVGYGYISLGAAYLKSGQPKSAVKFMAMAKDITDATVGHLSLFCQVKQRYRRVIKILEEVVKGCEGNQEFLEDAVKILNNLKGRVTESPTVASPQSIEDLCSTTSKCGISGVMK